MGYNYCSIRSRLHRSVFTMASTRFGILVRSFSTSGACRNLIQPPVQVFGLEGRYATALYSAAMKKESLDAVDKDIKTLAGLLKTEAINSVLAKKNACPLTVNLFGALAENGRMANVDGVLGAFGTIMAAVRGEVICEVTTAKPLDAAMRKELDGALAAFLKEGESIQLTTKVDPAIMGGMIVSIGDKYVDMSLASKINKYTALLQQAV